MSTPVPANPSAPPPQPAVGYAPARPAGLSALIDHLGPGYAVVRLPPPSMRLEVTRLVGLSVGAAVSLVALAAGPKLAAAAALAGGWRVDETALMIALGLTLLVLTLFAVAVLAQVRRVWRSSRRPNVPDGSVTFCRPEALTEAPDAFTVLRIAVETPPLGIASAHLRVETSSGKVLELLRGHSAITLDKLADDLKAHLLVSHTGVPDATEAR